MTATQGASSATSPTRRAIAFLLTLAGATLLAGCFEIGVDVAMQPDGSGALVTRIGVARAIYEMQPAAKQADMCKEIRPKDASEGEGEKYVEGDAVFCKYTKRFANIHDLAEEGMRIESAGAGAVRLTMDFARMSEMKGKGSAGAKLPVGKQADLALMKAMLAGKMARFRVHAPHILSTNGLVSEDRKTAEYAIPLTEIIDAASTDKGLDRVFTVEFYCRSKYVFLKGC